MWIQSSKKKFDTAGQVYDYALDLLTVRDYSTGELQKKLSAKGAPEDFIAEAVRKLQEYGFLNERRYAYRVLEAWKAKKYYGRKHLEAELYKKNVASEYFAEINEAFSDEEEYEHALTSWKLFLKKNKKRISEHDSKLYAAAARFMAARGFSTRYVHSLMSELQFQNNI